MAAGMGYCHRCGTPLPPGATFCPRCGAAVATSTAVGATPQQPAPQWRGEKAEKHEKHEKREKGEKSGFGGMLGAVVGGLVLIWLGTTFYLEQNGYLASDIWWANFISGVGVVLVLEGIVIYSRGHIGIGPVVGGALLIFGGVSAISTNNYRFQSQVWPLVIVVVGALVILMGLGLRRRVPAP